MSWLCVCVCVRACVRATIRWANLAYVCTSMLFFTHVLLFLQWLWWRLQISMDQSPSSSSSSSNMIWWLKKRCTAKLHRPARCLGSRCKILFLVLTNSRWCSYKSGCWLESWTNLCLMFFCICRCVACHMWWHVSAIVIAVWLPFTWGQSRLHTLTACVCIKGTANTDYQFWSDTIYWKRLCNACLLHHDKFCSIWLLASLTWQQ